MPVYVPEDGVPARTVFEDISRRVVDQYALAERRILAELARRADRLLLAPGPTERLQQQLVDVQELHAQAVAALARIDDDLARQAMAVAVDAGTAAAAARIGLAAHLPTGRIITTGHVRALTLLQADLHNRFEDVTRRILRWEQDAYQALTADTVPGVLLGTTGRLDAQRAAVARWLGDGIPGFVDTAGREWSTGAYVEMATRTALQRAYTESGIIRMGDAGLNLVTIVVGVSACRPCAAQIGRILSTDGTTGQVTLPHAGTGQPITITVDGTLDGARAAGWGHPNCRCHVAAYLPGLPIPAAATTYDPVAERALQRQRELERRLRRDKRRLSLQPTDTDQAAELKARIRATQSTLRQHIGEHDLPRKLNREQPAFSG